MDQNLCETIKSHQIDLGRLLNGALALDLEVSSLGTILKIGAVLGNETASYSGGQSIALAMDKLSRMAQSASCVLGHNLVAHDLPILREKFPQHPILQLPVIDTLILSPLAFPENPYHRLVKDYKIASESVNDPVADSLQARLLFCDEFRSFNGLKQTEPQLFDLLHFLLATPSEETRNLAHGMEMFFSSLGGLKPSLQESLELCRNLFRKWACASKPVSAALFETHNQRLAVAYGVSWLRIAGSNSVLPPWVRLHIPETRFLLDLLRETPCSSPDCQYCRRAFDAREQLRRFFNWDEFRPLPRNAAGTSLQQEIVESGIRNQSLLAILPTGGGKSLCFQLPALARNYRRGVLTIVISPLQALMKDQVDGLVRRTGTPFAAALYGLLTPVERGDLLRRISLGDVALLYVSPEQLRNRSFHNAIAQREIGCWVFDEAHCLSKWGHDFRPDYLYAARFIREFSKAQGVEIPSIACFTATAKNDVKEEIVAFFKNETGRDLQVYEGGVERTNLRFEVQPIAAHGKLERIHDLLSEHFRDDSPGCAIVFRATRAAAEETSSYLRTKNWSAAHFHAGLTPPEKKQIQDEFLAGNTKVICATNAFGMGIDKEDVRLVIHADTPGSLENYLQEAGRAGRDGELAECILIYDEEDCEKQFRLGAFSEISRRDIAQILQTLRRASRARKDEVVITAGEILRDELIQTEIDVQERGADTKVRAAISWLERAGFVQRDENVTKVFQARLLIRNMEEAEMKMASLKLSESETALWKAILREFMNARVTDALSVDQLALLPEFTHYVGGRHASGARTNPEYLSGKILKIMWDMSQVGIMKRDMLLSAYLRYKVVDHSRIRLDRVLQVDRKLTDLLAIAEPDPEGWMPLSLRLLNQALCDQGLESSTEVVQLLLKSLSEDGRGFAGTHGSIELLHHAKDSYRVRVRRTWTAIQELAEKRRRIASLLLDALLDSIPAETPASAELLVEFSFDKMHQAIENDLVLRSEIKDIDAALERGLMFLHEQRVITLQNGLAVFRSAMTIRLNPAAKGEKYKTSDYQPLEHHYRERILQVHVMSEYARVGLARISEALKLVLAYFTLDKEQFIQRYLQTKRELLAHATTARSFQRIITDLNNPEQVKVVTAPQHRNMLILAGPGSGKTKTVVHRCAHLLRIDRVRPQSILVCCFNRSAALELRRRLADLVGDDARGVTIQTYHGLAMRLLGHSFSGQANGPEINFDALITDATALLRGETVPLGMEPDEVRDRLLAGFQYILVDEYQDIDEAQYEMISALAGRTLDDPDLKLSILAVGDDDQNIYAFRGTNVAFIRRFQEDYKAEVAYLIANYRSTANIIEVANALIGANVDRMKSDFPIRIDEHRRMLPAGGEFGKRDTLTQGKVQVIQVENEEAQAGAVVAEIRRLKQLGITDLSQIAVLSSHRLDLARIRTQADAQGIPVRWAIGQNGMPPLHRIREVRHFLLSLSRTGNSLVRASELSRKAAELLEGDPKNTWLQFLSRIVEAWRIESGDAELPVTEAVEFLYEACAESRRDFSYGEGVVLNTVHSAKGTEYDHVLLAGARPLESNRDRQEETRRAFYVGMSRARQSLSVFDRRDISPSLPETLNGPAILRRDWIQGSETSRLRMLQYATLGMDDLFLGFPGCFDENHAIHSALARLKPGELLTMRRERETLRLFDGENNCVARLSQKGEATWQERLNTVRQIRVLAMVTRTSDQESDPVFRERCRVSEWEIPLAEVIFDESAR